MILGPSLALALGRGLAALAGASLEPDAAALQSAAVAGPQPAAPGTVAPGTPAPPGPPVQASTLTEPWPEQAVYGVPLAHTGAVLVGMRVSLSLIWTDAYNPFPLSRSLAQLQRAYTEPPELRRDRNLLESDGDPWPINVLGHGLFGAEVYGRFRRCGSGIVASAGFAAATSAFWELGPEALHKRPSAVDLVVTPVLGAALGEARYQLQRWLRGRPGGWRALGVVVDPLGSAERAWLGTRC